MSIFKANWQTAPEWAEWFARNSKGGGFFFEKEPRRCKSGWGPQGGRVMRAGQFETLNWQNSLECRPD